MRRTAGTTAVALVAATLVAGSAVGAVGGSTAATGAGRDAFTRPAASDGDLARAALQAVAGHPQAVRSGTRQAFSVTGALVDPDGTTHDRLVGVESPWCDLAGTATADGAEAPVGLALFDHPANRRFPTPFYASTWDGYGEGAWTNFFNAAFLFHEGMDLAADEPLRVRHRTVVHDGHWPTDRLQAEWERWATPPG